MSIGRTFVFPPEQQRLREKAKVLSWLSIGLLISAAVLLFFTLGQSEAMKTAWVSDVLSAVPPSALLVAMQYELRPPTKRFPYGYTRSVAVAFLATSGVLSLIGLYLLYNALTKLLSQQRPPIGAMEMGGYEFWAGWAMMVALGYSLLCGLTLGLLKKPVAKALHDRSLNAEATMNRDEWISEGAAIIGILLVAFGYWWGDSAAAAFIALEIVHDGWMNMRLAVGDLMDETPTRMGTQELEDITEKVRAAVEEMDWVAKAGVRLRGHGRQLTGEVFVQPRDGAKLVDCLEQAANHAAAVDWRLHDIAVMAVAELADSEPPRAEF